MRTTRGFAAALLTLLTAAWLAVPASPPAVAATPTRWVAVNVATLWTRPGIDRPVDASAVATPADPARWVAAMTTAQKRWLVGRLETQALYGTRVLVTATTKDSRGRSWSKLVVPSQPTPRDSRGYPGWVPTRQLTATAPASSSSYAVVTARLAWVYSSAATVGTTAGRVVQLAYDTRLPVAHASASAVEVVMLGGRHRVLRSRDVAVRAAGSAVRGTRAGVVAAARTMLGLGYLWGGTSGFGYDCSGLTYAVFDVAGIRLRRDADQQARHGTTVSWGQLRAGDLVFYKSSSGAIVHVALYVGTINGKRSMLEAPQTGVPVRITPLRSSGYAGARRYPLG